MDYELMIPDSYHPSVYDINYSLIRDNGIKYAVFDVDCTILPFDDINVGDDLINLFDYIKSLGIQSALCSSGSKKRVEVVGEKLDINYMYGARKPYVGFNSLKSLFDDDFERKKSVFIGDSPFFDMYNAGKINMNKILVDMLIQDFNFKAYTNEFIRAALFKKLRVYGLEEKKYYRGSIER